MQIAHLCRGRVCHVKYRIVVSVSHFHGQHYFRWEQTLFSRASSSALMIRFTFARCYKLLWLTTQLTAKIPRCSSFSKYRKISTSAGIDNFRLISRFTLLRIFVFLLRYIDYKRTFYLFDGIDGIWREFLFTLTRLSSCQKFSVGRNNFPRTFHFRRNRDNKESLYRRSTWKTKYRDAKLFFCQSIDKFVLYCQF